MDALVQRQMPRLNSRDQMLKRALQMTGNEEMADIRTDLQPSNIRELEMAIQSAKTPQQREILMEEARRLARQQQLLSPMRKMPLLPEGQAPFEIQHAPYDPAQGLERQGGQQQLGPLPRMTY